MAQRSTRQQIAKAVQSMTKPIRKHNLTRTGTHVPTDLDNRKADPLNFRDLSDTVRHLTYHICPFATSTESWQWNLEQLRKRWHLFNGLKVIGINHDKDTVTPDDILDYCKTIRLHWDNTVIRENSRALGEVMTWIPSLELLSPETASENEVVFSAHAKGVKYGQVMPPVIASWAEIMYGANLDDWGRVRSSLEWFMATGALRGRYSKTRTCKHGWYYSGAFWWWRLADIGKRAWRDVGPWYAGRELWIGHQIAKHESDCLFHDNTRSPYNPAYMNSVIVRKWKEHKGN